MHRVEHVMGFPVSLRVDDEHVGEETADAVFAWLREVDARFSPFRADSEVCRLDRGEIARRDVSVGLDEVLPLCEEYRLATGGAFDVRLPGRGLDLCAVVKGWSVQRAAELLRAADARRFVLNAGGDVVASGGPWRVGVRELCTVLELTEGAVATSARYERGDHIVDGRTGRPATGLLSLSVVASSLRLADREGCEVFAVDAGRNVMRTEGFPTVPAEAQAA
ncbi:FAD:protein FMN transferase [Streptomyces nigra]|uniref:FAD:protein FMN transferase n=1 Tax=Streptomyces nigra TaxID=1827580 RepID=UPI0037F11B10